jgi:sulfate permease, SulP family
MPHPWFSNVRGDITGGLVSAALAIPLAVGFGMFAFVALGDEYFTAGALAGLYTAFVVGIACVALGDRSTTLYAPRVTTTFFIGLLLFELVHSDAAFLKSGPAAVLLVLFAIILLGAIFQLLFGLVRLGTLLKFTPHPVMAGFQNAAALLLFLVQIGNVMGFDRNVPYTAAVRQFESAKPLSLLIALATGLAMWHARRLLPKVPPLLVGLVLGVAIYYGLLALGLGAYLGPVIGTAGAALEPLFASFPRLDVDGTAGELLPTIFGGALALAFIASIDALLCARLVTAPGAPKSDSNRLLARLGLGNIVAAGFGGITSGINIGPSLVNRAFGGRTPLSVLVNAAVVLLAFTLLFPLVAAVPRAVLSAVIMVVAIQHLDPWTVQMARRVTSAAARQRRLILLELFVMLVVAVLSVTVNIVLAVFMGIVLAVLLFVLRMSRSNIRRSYRCDAIHSRKSRTAKEMELLEREGRAIVAMELEGALFFGSAERLANEIDAAMLSGTRVLVLDLRRVNDIDSTGAQIVVGVSMDLARNGQRLGLALHPSSETAARLADLCELENVTAFDDVDRAIEWAEDVLLGEARGDEDVAELALNEVGILRGLNAVDIAALEPYLKRSIHPKGSVLFSEGDPGRELFIVVKGAASAYLRQANSGDIRLVTFAPGTVFGELAILDAGPRSATVTADSELVCYGLNEGDFATLSARSPAVAIKLLAALGRELSGRLRRANRTIRELEV